MTTHDKTTSSGTATAEPEESAPRSNGRRAVVIALSLVAAYALLLVVGEFAPGAVGQLARSMAREAISPQTAGVAIAVIGLNLHFGFAGLLNIGQAGFMLLGAYGFAIAIAQGAPVLVAVLCGLLAAVAFALVLGIPTLKLRGDYLAIVTISAAEIIRYVGRSAVFSDYTGASGGIRGADYRGPFMELSFLGDGTGGIWFLEYQMTGVNGWWVRLVAWTLVAVCALAVFLLVRSPWGRLLRGIREDETAMLSLGKNAFMVKMQALVLGGMLAALGGMVYVLASSVQADAMGRQMTFFIWTALLIGGAASIFGPVLGAVVFFTGRVLVQGLSDVAVPDSLMNTQQTQQFSWIVVGVALMLLVIFRPQGIVGDKKELRFDG